MEETRNEEKKKEKVYIDIYKTYCDSPDSKFKDKGKYHRMRLPPGTIVGDRDLSGAWIRPPVMDISKFNENMMCGTWYRNGLDNNAIKVFIKGVNGEKGETIRVDADVLKDAVKAANREYMQKRERERAAEAEASKQRPAERTRQRRYEQEYEV